MFLLIKKKKNIAVIINTTNSISDLYFGHFVRAEDIPQSCMLSFLHKIKFHVVSKLFQISSITKVNE